MQCNLEQQVHLHDDAEVYPIPDQLSHNRAHISGFGHYQRLYEESISQMPVFWDRVRQNLSQRLLILDAEGYSRRQRR